MTNGERSLETKIKLSNALKSQLKKKNLTKISVSELIRICNINRNTFYYHFDNIYDLFEWTVKRDVFDKIEKMDQSVGVEEIFRFMVDYCEDNIQVIKWVYEVMDYRTRYKCFGNKLHEIIKEHVVELQKEMNVEIDKEEADFFSAFFTDAFISAFYRFINGETGYTKEQFIQMIIFTMSSSLKQLVREKGKSTEI